MTTDSSPLSDNQIKDILGKKAAELPEAGMVIGLGTGTTAHCFILHLAERCKKGLNITAVASSEKSAQLAKDHGIRIVSLDEVPMIDLTVDGADEIDENKRMIKGGGGALLREKIVAFASRKVVIIVTENKAVTRLGKHLLPIEVLPFGHIATKCHLEALGYAPTLRMDKEKNKPWITDNGNYIFDIAFPNLLETPEFEERHISALPGVIETGFFFDLADEVMIGHADGQITLL